MAPGGGVEAGGVGPCRDVNHVEFTVAGGAAGFINTDISALLAAGVPANVRYSLWAVYPGANQNVGVRKAGGVATSQHGGPGFVHTIAGACQIIGSRVDLYRDTANNIYYCVGWIV